jgi:hypothetical protein
METKNASVKMLKFKKMLADAERRKETMIVNLLNEIKPAISGDTSEVKFDETIFKKIQALVISATNRLKKKEQTVAEQEIYSISLLSVCFFDNQVKVSIEKNKVKIQDMRV